MVHSLWILPWQLLYNISQTRRITLKSKKKGEKERKEIGRMLTRRKRRTKETFRTTEKHIKYISK
jgi:hypothetical protein